MTEQTPLLELAEHYYIVAEDLRRRGMYLIEAADFMASSGDVLCEQNTRETAPKEPPK